MLRLLVAYTTYDGHTAKVAERIAAALKSADCAVEVCDLARMRPDRPLREYDGVVAGAPLHSGKHPRTLAAFVTKNCTTLNTKPSAFFSVSLSAAGNDQQRDDATRCLEEFLKETGWKPSKSTIVAGALLYRKYGFFKRWLMKRIVSGGGGDTDTSRNHVYTEWEALDKFAHQLIRDWTARKSVPIEKALA